MELNMEFTIIQGDTIRAYDFKPMLGRSDCFVEGKVLDPHAVISSGVQAYKIRITRDVFDGKEFTEAGYKSLGNRVGEIVYVPWFTTRDYQGRIINLSR